MGQESGTGNSTVILLATGAAVRIRDDNVQELITIHAVGCPTAAVWATRMRRGSWHEPASFDFRVAKPWGNIDPYDVLVGMGRGILAGPGETRYPHLPWAIRGKEPEDIAATTPRTTIDFIAAHVVQENIWYIVQSRPSRGRACLHFNPHGRREYRYEKYREAWCLLACDPKARGWKDIPVVCRCKDLPVRCAVCPHKEE